MLAWNHAKELIVYYLRHMPARLIFIKMIKNADAALLPLLDSTHWRIGLCPLVGSIDMVRPLQPSLAYRAFATLG
jgi:hypothetical protein